MSMLNVFNIAGSALHAQSARLNATASNLANADSVAGPDGQPYRAKQVVFAATQVAGLNGVGVQVTQVVESAEMTFRYIPARSEQRGGLLFRNDPRKHELRLRAQGYGPP